MKPLRSAGFAFVAVLILVVLSSRTVRSNAALQPTPGSAFLTPPAPAVTLGRLLSKTLTGRFNQSSDAVESEYESLDKMLHENHLTSDNYLQILTMELPVFYLKQDMQAALHVTGGARPYHFEIVQDALPKGISFDNQNGVFFGRAEEELVSSIVIRVTDETGAFAEKEFLMMAREVQTETEGNFAFVSTPFPDAVVGKYYYEPVPVAGGQKPYQFKIDPASLPPGIQFHPGEGIFYGQPLATGTYPISVEVKDADGNVLNNSYEIKVSDSPLYLTSPHLEEGWVGRFYHVKLEALGGRPPYHWTLQSGKLSKGLTFYPKTGVISGMPLQAVNTKLILSVTDGDENYDSAELNFIIHQDSLQFEIDTLPNGYVGRFFYVHLSARGGEPPYRWEIDGKLPEGLIFQKESGVIFGTPKEAFNETIEVSVIDQSQVRASASFRLKIIQNPLTLSLPPELVLSVGKFYFLSLNCQGGVPEYEWDGSNLPEGLSLFPTGFLVGTPVKAEQMIAHVRVRDKSGDVVSGNMAIQVLSEVLEITTAFLNEAKLNEFYRVQFAAHGGTFPYLWSLVGQPSGLILDSASGIFSGTPLEAGDFSLAVQVKDSANRQVNAEIPFTVLAEPLQITDAILPDGFAGTSYQTVIGVKGGKAPYSWNIIGGGLPANLKLNSSTGLISGIPSKGEKTSFEIQVTDQRNSKIQKTFQLNIDGDKLRILTETLPEATISELYSHPLSAEGGVEPYQWFIGSGSLPPDVSLSSSAGILSGTPKSSGLFSFTVGLRDAAGEEIQSHLLLLKVLNEPLALHSEDLPDAHVGEPYEFVFEASGGETPYAWAIKDGTLPEGLELKSNGKITGVPWEAFQEESFILQLKDHKGTSVQKGFTLFVQGKEPAPPEGFFLAASDGKVGLAWQIPNDPTVAEVRLFRAAGGWPDVETDSPVYVGVGDQFLDTGLVNGQEYFYVITTFNSHGMHSQISSEVKRSTTPNIITLSGPNDPYADQVISFTPLSPNGFGAAFLPGNVLGPPAGMGASAPQASASELVSLHARANNDGGKSAPYGGSIVLEFDDNLIVNGPGFDFTVFENVFFAGGNPLNRWMEPAVVSVSQDGGHFYDISFDYVPHYTAAGVEIMTNPYSYPLGFAGIEPIYSFGTSPDPTNPAVSGGDHFDLSWVSGKQLLWVKYVKIQSTGDKWLVDMNGDLVRHTAAAGALSGASNSGFDFDAVCAINY